MTCVATRSYFFVLDATIRNWEHRELTRKTTIIYGTSGDVVTWTEVIYFMLIISIGGVERYKNSSFHRFLKC